MKSIKIFWLFWGLLLVLPIQASAGEADQNTKSKQQDTIVLSLDQLSSEEKEWFVTFQEGTFYARGWRDITRRFLRRLPRTSGKGNGWPLKL